jgi:hypothetical protein
MSKLNLTVEDAAPLEQIWAETGRRTVAEVIRDAITVYAHLIWRVLQGDRLFIGRDRTSARELAITPLETARARARERKPDSHSNRRCIPTRGGDDCEMDFDGLTAIPAA